MQTSLSLSVSAFTLAAMQVCLCRHAVKRTVPNSISMASDNSRLSEGFVMREDTFQSRQGWPQAHLGLVTAC